MQASEGMIKTKEGDVRMKCCYCEKSHFHTQTGKLILNNVHKNCTVDIQDCGILQMGE